jgi:DNA-binding SARP family transcriptional activator
VEVGVDFRVLGPLEVLDGADVVPVPGAKQGALLALLLLHANEIVSSSRLLDELWGDAPPESGLTALQVRASQLRKALGSAGDAIVTRPPGYVLQVAAEQVDLHRFERLVGEADRALQRDEPAPAWAQLQEALALWRGPALADFAYESFAQAAIGRLEELRVVAQELRVDAGLRLARHAELVVELEALVAQHPLRERLRGQLMLALYRNGRQAEALDAYHAGRWSTSSASSRRTRYRSSRERSCGTSVSSISEGAASRSARSWWRPSATGRSHRCSRLRSPWRGTRPAS